MKDYNFFADYKVKKIKRTKSSQAVTLFSMVVVGLIAGLIAYNYIMMISQLTQIRAIETELESLKNTDDIIRVIGKETLLTELENTAIALGDISFDEDFHSSITEDLLAILADAMPSDVKIVQIDIIDNEMTVVGESLDESAVAEYAYRLKLTKTIEEIFINYIEFKEAEEGNVHIFSMNIIIGGGTSEN